MDNIVAPNTSVDGTSKLTFHSQCPCSASVLYGSFKFAQSSPNLSLHFSTPLITIDARSTFVSSLSTASLFPNRAPLSFESGLISWLQFHPFPTFLAPQWLPGPSGPYVALGRSHPSITISRTQILRTLLIYLLLLLVLICNIRFQVYNTVIGHVYA